MAIFASAFMIFAMGVYQQAIALTADNKTVYMINEYGNLTRTNETSRDISPDFSDVPKAISGKGLDMPN